MHAICRCGKCGGQALSERRLSGDYDESKHPRHPAGDEHGGEWAPKVGDKVKFETNTLHGPRQTGGTISHVRQDGLFEVRHAQGGIFKLRKDQMTKAKGTGIGTVADPIRISGQHGHATVHQQVGGKWVVQHDRGPATVHDTKGEATDRAVHVVGTPGKGF